MLNQRALIISVNLRISFVRLPDVESERVFRDTLLITDTEGHALDDLESVIEKKIAFMEYPPCDYTIFFNDPSGDRIVVDHSYYYKMVSQWSKLQPQCAPCIGESQLSLLDNENSGMVEVSLSVEVEINKVKPFLSSPASGKTEAIPLTLENLNKIKTVPHVAPDTPALGIDVSVKNTLKDPVVSSAVSIPIKLLSCPAPSCGFFVKGVIIGIRMKTVKTGLDVVEVDICDMADPEAQITAVSFDATVIKAIKENLRADRRQVVELHRIYLRRKNETDIRFQSNSHPLLIRLDKHSRIEVVQILSIPVQKKTVESVVTVRRNMSSGGFVDVSDLVSGTDMVQKKSHTYTSSASENSSIHSSSITSGPRRTTFSIQQTSTSTSITEIPRSERKVANAPLLEPGIVHTNKRDVHAREKTVAEFSSREEERKERIRRRKEVSSQCMLCGLDLSDEKTSMSIVRRLLEANRCNRGTHIPLLKELISSLSDNRMNRNTRNLSGRLLSNATFVNVDTRTVHRVHCRCAHLCSSYQLGKSIEDIVSCDLACSTCSLCGLAGAIVSCYHPDCKEQYHSICALYSKGYVNFGKKDPYMPCPACPRHTQVVASSDPNEVAVLHEDVSCWDDNIVFDSRVVESTDLRDPDENGGL